MFLECIIKSYFDTGKIEIESKFTPERVKDIVFVAMKNTNRFNGLIEKPCSLIEHCFFVSKYAQDLYKIYVDVFDEREYQMVGLLGLIHDLGEVVVGDMVYPLKTRNFCNMEIQKLEMDFLKWFMDYVYNYKLEINEELMKYVTKADHHSGVFELIGISLNDDFETKHLFGSLIEANNKFLKVINNDEIQGYEKRLEFILKGLKHG